jgi:hypothetical protein
MTLIEVLIAVTLVSLLAVTLLMALRVGLNALEVSNRHLLANRRALGAHRILEQQFAGFLPVVAECGAGVLPAGLRVPFFQGEPLVMRFVSRYSLEGGLRGQPKILEFLVAPGENAEGVRLLVNELPYPGPRGAGFHCLPPAPDPMLQAPLPRFLPAQPGPRSFVLADRLAFCRFVFQEALPRPNPDRWVPRWVNWQRWPKSVRIEMAPLAPDRARVQPFPFSATLRVTHPPLEPYEY